MFRTITFLCLTLLTLTSYAGDEPKEKEYIIVIDTESRYIWKADPKIKLPTTNPKTRKETITQAMYCEKCECCDKWKPVPLKGNVESDPVGFSCPIHKEPLKAEGKIPKDLGFIEESQAKRIVK